MYKSIISLSKVTHQMWYDHIHVSIQPKKQDSKNSRKVKVRGDGEKELDKI